MFDTNFSFGGGARSASLDSAASSSAPTSLSRSVSPCSELTAYPQPQFTVTDLAASFGRSRLRHEAQICYDPCAAYAATDDDAGWQLSDDEPVVASIETGTATSASRAAARTPRARAHSPTRRVQRQSNGRLLCSASHHKDIAALVSRMVARGDQCSVAAAPGIGHGMLGEAAGAGLMVPSTAADDDEGYDSSEYFEPAPRSRQSSSAMPRHRLEYRRSSEFKSTTGACVNKAIRLRKDRSRTRRKLEA